MYPSLRGLPEAATTAGEREPVAAGARATRVATPVVLLGVTSMLTDVSSEMVATVLPLYLTVQLGLSPLAYGFVDGLYQGVTVLVRLAAGVAADRTRRPKAVAVVGYGASAVAKLALLPATALTSVSAVIAVDRTGKGIRTAPRDALIVASSPSHALGRAFGVHRALDTLGAMAGPLLAFALLAAIPGGYDAVFVTSFAFAVVGVAVLVTWVPDLRPAMPSTGRNATLRSVAGLLRDRPFRRTLLAAGALAAVTVSDGFLYLVLQRRTDLAPELFPLLFVGTTLVYFLLAVPLGRLADRVGRRRVYVGGHVALLGAYACAGGPLGDVAATAGCLALLGAYYAATDGVLSALSAPLLPESLRSTGLAAVQTVTAGGRFLAALGFGAVWTVAGPGGALVGFSLALLVAVPAGAVLLGPDRRVP
jgi:MFS family permease